jgi:hypothetical protein
MLILDLVARSAATEAFRAAVEQFCRTGAPGPVLEFDPRCPPVKVERTLIQMLQAFPSLPIARVAVQGSSGCEFFRGTVQITAEEQSTAVQFEWNCRWKAEEMGWVDWFGLPDQSRAAREFGHDCFRVWKVVSDQGAMAGTAA